MLAQGNTSGFWTWVLIGLLILLVVLVLLLLKFINLWIQAYMSGTRIGFLQLVGMSLRKVNPSLIMLSSCLNGQSGPHRDLAGFGTMGQQIAGFGALAGWAMRLRWAAIAAPALWVGIERTNGPF